MRELVIVLSMLFAVMSFLMIGEGIHDATSTNYSKQDCYTPKARIEYIIPLYRFGCWLGETP